MSNCFEFSLCCSLPSQDFSKFNVLKPKLLETVDKMLSDDIARLMTLIPLEEGNNSDVVEVHGGAFKGCTESPFGIGKLEGTDQGRGEECWIVEKSRYKYDDIFESLAPVNGKISGASAKSELVKSKLPNSILGKIWKMSDIDRDGMLDADEFALAMYLIELKLEGHELPLELPDHLVPPGKRAFSE